MTKNEKERNSIFAIPLLYNAGSVLSIKLLSVMKLLSATGFCIEKGCNDSSIFYCFLKTTQIIS